MAPDDVLRDLQEEPSVKALSLPQAEQAKQRAMEELEDDRLERCRSAAAFEFDQCFFFGPSGTTAARRPMEGAGTLRLTPSARETEHLASLPLPLEGGPRKMPTW